MLEPRIAPAHMDILRRVVSQHLPHDTRVFMFGSRVTGRRLKAHSDVDLLIESPQELSTLSMTDLREALIESDLPFSVDLLDKHEASAEFLNALRGQPMAELALGARSLRVENIDGAR